MHKALADFRVESDTVVFLAFTDGQSYRVAPKDLERVLKQDDLRRVRRALRLRNQFMRRVLPPTVMVVLLAGIIGLGRYDVYRVAHSWLAPTAKPTKTQVQAVAPAAQRSAAAADGANPAVAGSAVVGSAAAAPVSSALGSDAAKAAGTVPSLPARPTAVRSTPGLAPLAPVTTTVQTVPQVLQPITAPLTHTVQQLPLSKLLP